MTASAEQPFTPDWRERREREQQAALPEGELRLTCSAPLGSGGLGRHAWEILAAAARNGTRASAVCGPGGAAREPREEISPGTAARTLSSLLRRSPPLRMWCSSVAFDRAAARRTPHAGHLLAFSGQAHTQLMRARRAGLSTLGLVSPTSHLRAVSERYEAACRRHPIERPWTPRVLARSLAEYELADTIYASCEYVRESFLAAGVSEERLRMLPLTPAPRFTAREQPPAGEAFELLYVGSLSVVKGVPLLLEAFARLEAPDLRLVLQGGWESRGMRRHVQEACARDPRIELRGGDTLASLRRASLYVHPSYEDGFSYSTAEALACGVPALVSENTGAKELIEPGRSGVVLRSGDLDALTEAIAAAHRGDLLGG